MDLIGRTIEFVSQYHASDHSGHGTDHIMRVWRTALKLADPYGPAVDSTVLQLAALLHDVDDHKINPDGHVAEDYLKECGLDETTRQRVMDTIRPIGFSMSGAHPKFDTLEQMLLSDADKLDAMGAIGICRTVAYGAVKGRPLYGAKDCTLQHFYDKLLLLREAMQTPQGLQEAELRHRYMEAFLEELGRECTQ